jgi:hypothetical protein
MGGAGGRSLSDLGRIERQPLPAAGVGGDFGFFRFSTSTATAP